MSFSFSVFLFPQNDHITKLKIENNPFAKGFRITGQSRCKRKLAESTSPSASSSESEHGPDNGSKRLRSNSFNESLCSGSVSDPSSGTSSPVHPFECNSHRTPAAHQAYKQPALPFIAPQSISQPFNQMHLTSSSPYAALCAAHSYGPPNAPPPTSDDLFHQHRSMVDMALFLSMRHTNNYPAMYHHHQLANNVGIMPSGVSTPPVSLSPTINVDSDTCDDDIPARPAKKCGFSIASILGES